MTVRNDAFDRTHGRTSIDVGNTLLRFNPNSKRAKLIVISDDGSLHDLEQCIKELRENLGIAT